MKNYVVVEISEQFRLVTIQFNNEADLPLDVGQEMNKRYEDAYMNGYNWAAFLRAYLSIYAEHLLQDLEEDPEAGSYYASYPLSTKNKEKAKEFKNLIVHLVENRAEIFKFLDEHFDDIEWD